MFGWEGAGGGGGGGGGGEDVDASVILPLSDRFVFTRQGPCKMSCFMFRSRPRPHQRAVLVPS